MIYSYGGNFDFISSAKGLLANPNHVSAWYNSIKVTTDTPSVGDLTYYYNSLVDIHRNGYETTVPAYQLQIGDVINLESTDVVVTQTQIFSNYTSEQYFHIYNNVKRNNIPTSLCAHSLEVGDVLIYDDIDVPITAVDKPMETVSPIMNLLVSNSGFHTPEHAENAIYVARTTKFNESDKNDYINPIDNWYEKVFTGEDSKDSKVNFSEFSGPWGFDCTSPHDELYMCLNWWEFTKTPTDMSIPSAHINKIYSDYGGYSNVEFSSYYTIGEAIRIKNKDVEIVNSTDGSKPHNFRITKAPWMPDHVGGAILFSAMETFDPTKYVAIGFKGIRSFNMTNVYDTSYKLYRFTDEDGYFKSIGNNYYIFNDSNIVSVKGIDDDTEYGFGYCGPFFLRVGLSAGTYDSNKNKVETLRIDPNDNIDKPCVVTSISYMLTGSDIPATSGKPLNCFYVTNSNDQCHIKYWNDTPNNATYFDCVPYAPGIPISTGYDVQFELQPDITEVEFGAAMSAMGCIFRYSDTPFNKLTNINGNWNYCKNISVFGNPGRPVFLGASALTTIPSSWEGLESVTSIGLEDFFAGCKSLTAVPSSFDHFGGLSAYTNAASAFYNCESLQTGLKNWKGFEGATTLQQAFYNCYLMPEIPSSWEGLNGNSVYLESTFKNCRSLKAIPSSFKDTHITYIGNAFENCSSLETMNTSWEGLEDCNYTNYAFHNCTSITKIPSKWTGLGTNCDYPSFDYMFMNCISLTGIDSWTDFNGKNTQVAMFMNCTSLRSLPTTWQGFNANNADSAFANCTSLTDIPASWEGKPNSPDFTSLFEGCTSLTGIPTTQEAWAGFGNGNITRMFANCTSLRMDPKPIMDGLNRPGAGSQMFIGCTNLAYTATYITQSAYSSYFV